MKGEKIPVTLGMLTRNSGATLRRALESAQYFDDIIVCDGGSTDDTLAIAREFGVRILEQDKQFLDPAGRLFDYAGARNQTLDAAKHNWFFFLDSDEYCGADQVDAVRAVIQERGEEGSGAFWVNRKYVIRGEVIDHAATYPNRQMRFFARRSAEHFIKQVHERIKIKEGVVPEILPGVMYIPFDLDIPSLRRKWGYQIEVQVHRGKPLSLGGFFRATAGILKVSLLWSLRLVRIVLVGRGKRMPFVFEMERHRFHGKLLEALWQRVYIGKWRIAKWFSLLQFLGVVFASVILIFFSTLYLSEAPRVWYDEGYLTQVSMNLALDGAQALQIAPNTFVSTETVTTGFPVFAPVALSYATFGVGVLQGRAVMVIFIFSFAVASFFFMRALYGVGYATASVLLLSSFAMLYGNGKPVLGEVPGLLLLIVTLCALHYLEKSGYRDVRWYAALGLFAGLCVVTKPIFFLLLPALFLTLLVVWRRVHLHSGGFILACVLGGASLALWAYLQFEGTLVQLLSFYANPYAIEQVRETMIQNVMRFFTEATPFYTLVLLTLWLVSLGIRRIKNISAAEIAAVLFALLIVIAYVRLPGWYRYLFPAATVALLFLPHALVSVYAWISLRVSVVRRAPYLPHAVLALLFFFQLYQAGFSSYVAEYYDGKRTQALTAELETLDPAASFFIHNVPETVIFLPSRNYYQYIEPHPVVGRIGTEYLPLLNSGTVDYVIARATLYTAQPELFSAYRLRAIVDHYALLERN